MVLAIAVLFAELAADLQLASAAVTGSPIYWGTWLPGAPYTQAALDAFEAGTGKGQSIVHWGQAWVSGGIYFCEPALVCFRVCCSSGFGSFSLDAPYRLRFGRHATIKIAIRPRKKPRTA